MEPVSEACVKTWKSDWLKGLGYVAVCVSKTSTQIRYNIVNSER